MRASIEVHPLPEAGVFPRRNRSFPIYDRFFPLTLLDRFHKFSRNEFECFALPLPGSSLAWRSSLMRSTMRKPRYAFHAAVIDALALRSLANRVQRRRAIKPRYMPLGVS